MFISTQALGALFSRLAVAGQLAAAAGAAGHAGTAPSVVQPATAKAVTAKAVPAKAAAPATTTSAPAKAVAAKPAPASTSVKPAAASTSVKPAAASTSAKPKASSGLDPALAAVVDKVQARYDGARDFTAAFDQTLTSAVTKRATVSGGKVSFKKAGKMRWDYTTPEPRMVLADGSRLWLWEPEDQQAFRQDLSASQLPAALAFLTGRGKLTDEFGIASAKAGSYGKADDNVLELVPKKPSAQVQRVFFVVDAATSFVRETVVVDAQGNTNHLVFRDIRVNTGLSDGVFAWTPPAGTRIIDPSGAAAGPGSGASPAER